jgi:poly(3-hydroxybutyrate) depolymerase
MRIHEVHLLGERAAAVLTVKASSHEMQERLLAPYIQMPDAPMLFLVHGCGKATTMGAQRNLFSVSAPEMQNLMLTFPPHCVHSHDQGRNAQQLGQRLIQNLIEFLLANALHGPGGILYEWNHVG